MNTIKIIFVFLFCSSSYIFANYEPISNDNKIIEHAHSIIDSTNSEELSVIYNKILNKTSIYKNHIRISYILDELLKIVVEKIEGDVSDSIDPGELIEEIYDLELVEITVNPETSIVLNNLEGETNLTIEKRYKNTGTIDIQDGVFFSSICWLGEQEIIETKKHIQIIKTISSNKHTQHPGEFFSITSDLVIEEPLEDKLAIYKYLRCDTFLLDKNGGEIEEAIIENNSQSLQIELTVLQEETQDNIQGETEQYAGTRDFAISDFYLEKKDQLEKIEIHPNYQGNLDDFIFLNAYFTVHNYGGIHTDFPRVFGASYKNGNDPTSNSVTAKYIEGCRQSFSEYDNISEGNSCVVKTELLMSLDEDISKFEFMVRIGAPSSYETQEELYEKDLNYNDNRIDIIKTLDDIIRL